jgi:putative glycosyltransferase (TIGR04372 family)
MTSLDNIVYYWRQKFRRAIRDSWPVLLRKIIINVSKPFSILVALFVMCLRPVLVIRFGGLINERIGHFAGNTEMYLCERDVGIGKKGTLDIFYYQARSHSNQQLAKMWKRKLRVVSCAVVFDYPIRFLPGFKAHTINIPSDRDIKGLLKRTPVHLTFTPEEETEGYKILKSMGVPTDASFVCLHARDSAYLEHTHPERDWRYHDFNDTNVENYIKCAVELVKRGYTILRMSAFTNRKLKTENPGIIDYATVARSDFMDIFLEAKCSFHLGSPSGLATVPMVFRRPRAIVDMSALEYACTWSADEVFVPRKIWMIQERRFMTYREIFKSGAGRFLRTELYEEHGLELLDSTPEEIRDVAIEMDERLKGTWQTNEEDEELQRLFWATFPKSELHGQILSRIGTEFLRQNRELLEM